MKLKRNSLLAIGIGIGIASTGCTFGNGRICGPQTPIAYCDHDAYEKLAHPKPYIEKWVKPGATAEARGQDSANCGGGSGDDPPGFGPRRIKEARRSGETENETYRRLFHDWQRCMLKAGYRFTGPCYDNEISRASPACGAP